MEKKVKSYEELEKEVREREMALLQKKKGQTKFRSGGSVVITTSISNDFWTKAQQHGISWAEAMRVGISMLLAEKGEAQYDNKLNLWRKMDFFRQRAEEACQNVEELTKKLAERENIKFETKAKD